MKRSILNPFLGILLLVSSVRATSLTWDGNAGTEPNPAGGGGTWDSNLTSNWWDGVINVNWPALGGLDDDAVFANTAGTVSIASGGVTANDLTFNTTGYIVQGNTLTLNGATPTITTGSGITAALNSVIAGSSGLTKSGSGTLTLGGSNTFTGGLTIRGGTVMLANAGAINSATPNAVVLGLDGDLNPTLDVNGQSFNMASLTVGANVTGARIRTNAWGGPYVTGETTLNSALTVERYGNNTHEGFQNGGKITGNGAGSGKDSLIFERGGSNNFYWQAHNTVANDFPGHLRVKNGRPAQQRPGAVHKQGHPPTPMLTIDSGAAFSWNNSGTVTETLDGRADAQSRHGLSDLLVGSTPQL